MNLVACFRTRSQGLTDRGWDWPDPALQELVALAEGQPEVVLGGGEPSLRPDLPALLEALPQARLHTDGAPFTEGLRGLPLRRIRVDLHAARADAHDWLVGRAGAARAAVRCIRTALELGLDLEVECLLTRPTLPHVGETLDALHRLGVRRVRLRRIENRGPAAARFVSLSPRLARMGRRLEEGWREDLDIRLVGVPTPEAPGLAGEPWHAPGEHPLAAPFPDYQAVFGERELAGFLRRGLVGERAGQATLDLRTGTTRALRQRMVQLAERHAALELLADLDRPETPALIQDALRLFERVDARTVGSAEDWSRADRRHLKRLASLQSAT